MPRDDRQPASCLPRRRRPLRLGVLGLALLAWAGCSIEKHYEVLSFFFDGVPDPASIGQRGRSRGGVFIAILSEHDLYVQQDCAACHGPSTSFGFAVQGFDRLDSTVCLKCHADLVEGPVLLHAPVAANECLWCHEAHESQHLHLLKAPSPDLCLACHRFQFEESVPTPDHEDLSRDCLECHVGHGGTGPGFLRPPPDAPTEPESESPSPTDAASAP